MRHSFVPGELWPDTNGTHINAHGGGILFDGGRYYWFGEHKIEGAAGNRARVGVHAYSSTDLYNWQDEGIALAVSNDPESDIADGCVLERPKVVREPESGRYVMWFHLELKGQGYASARSGVAVADTPTGPYRFLNSFRPNAGILPEGETADALLKPDADGKTGTFTRDFEGGQMARDMNLFQDADGSIYHLYSSEENATTHLSLLTRDGLRPSGRYRRLFPRRSMEAHAMCRRKGRYYYIASGCTGWAPNAARAAVADSPWGPWRELGNPCTGPGAELTFGGQSTFILPVAGKEDAYIAMFDVWRPDNAIDGRYVWLPMIFTDDGFRVEYRDEWDLSIFDRH